jgi:hypothetical protein
LSRSERLAVLRNYRAGDAMPTNRTPRRRDWRRGSRLIVSPEALRLWRRAKTLRNKDSDEYKRTEGELQELLGLSKFEATVLGRPSLICCNPASDMYPIPCGCALAERWAEALEAADRERRDH